jgi:hypothetical protein
MTRRLSRRVAVLCAALAMMVFAAMDARSASVSELPTGVVYPIPVRLSFRLLNLTRLSEPLSEVGASVEYTLRWTDPALAFDRVAQGMEHIDHVGPEAEAQLARIWWPDVVIDNMITNPRAQSLSVSIFYDGRVVLIRRVDADFRELFDMGNFPFDRQYLLFTFAPRRHAADEVLLSSTEFDRKFSTLPERIASTNWIPRRIDLDPGSFYGWNAKPFSKVTVRVRMDRRTSNYVERLFIPFGAIMSLSLFLLWAPERMIAINQRATIVISALLALAALSFTFENGFPGSISMNSPVAFMISNGYFYLLFVLTVDLSLSQHNSRLARQFPFLLHAIRRNVRFTIPLIFAGMCVQSLFAPG